MMKLSKKATKQNDEDFYVAIRGPTNYTSYTRNKATIRLSKKYLEIRADHLEYAGQSHIRENRALGAVESTRKPG